MTLNLTVNLFGPLLATLWIIETDTSLGMKSRLDDKRSFFSCTWAGGAVRSAIDRCSMDTGSRKPYDVET